MNIGDKFYFVPNRLVRGGPVNKNYSQQSILDGKR